MSRWSLAIKPAPGFGLIDANALLPALRVLFQILLLSSWCHLMGQRLEVGVRTSLPGKRILRRALGRISLGERIRVMRGLAEMEMLRDLVVVIPGLTGSILKKDGKVVWGWSVGALMRTLASGGATIRDLALSGDDPNLNSLDDGVAATKLIPDAHGIPGFWKIDGYSALRNLVKRSFIIQEGAPNHVRPANYFEFPYDWRRDNRVAARALGRLVDALPRWRQHSGAADARVMVLAHSMGGLVARHWLEVLKG